MGTGTCLGTAIFAPHERSLRMANMTAAFIVGVLGPIGHIFHLFLNGNGPSEGGAEAVTSSGTVPRAAPALI